MKLVALLEAEDHTMIALPRERAADVISSIRDKSEWSHMRVVVDSTFDCKILDYWFSSCVEYKGKQVRALHIIIK